MDNLISQLVICHSGYEYADRPVALVWEGNRFEIRAIEGQWLTPGGKHFRVRTHDEQLFELLFSELNDEWRVNPV
jgi:hypothetical protein